MFARDAKPNVGNTPKCTCLNSILAHARFWLSGNDDDDESDNENGKERIIGVR